MDIIKQLKEDLNEAKKEDNKQQKQKMDQQEENNQVVEPLTQASEEVERLQKKKLKHDVIMERLSETQKGIAHYDTTSKEIEWQYEVRLQQFQYL